MTAMRLFVLKRTVDVSGTSGTGRVADGVEFGDGTAVIHWNTTPTSTAIYGSVDDIVRIHGHNGATVVEYIEP